MLTVIPSAIRAYDAYIDGIYYDLNGDKTASVTTARTNKYSGDIIIPEEITYNFVTYTVTDIGYMAFSSCTALTSITIPKSVTSIGGRAFYGCTGLTNINIPNSVTNIGGFAFEYCI